jgi:protoheme IX farnesyltransferase
VGGSAASAPAVKTAPELFGAVELDLGFSSALRKLTWYVELAKPRITFLILLVCVAAFWLGSHRDADPGRLFALAASVSVLASGMFALNQYLERDIDARMRRTDTRPLPMGRLTPAEALWFGLALSAVAIVSLAAAANSLTAALGLLTIASYLLLYTPLKRRTPHCTLIGAFPGAAPPLLGWAAARGELTAEAWVLFAILFFWQFPHFHSIACLYRDDYARAGVRLWHVVEPSGRTAGKQIAGAAALLIPVSLLPALLQLAGPVYVAGAVALGAGFLWFSLRLVPRSSSRRAQQLLLASVIYLPLLLTLMILDSGEMR